ncbi:ABC transporter permease [Nocardioides acrostichi]|uniref:ABC transporter permease n=1 Tax=Nocardioides acrostichi TaxID=2784339 RepID=UPI002E2A3F0A|nr:ABC transporter permease [Nocardioides acrostichi]
MTSPELEELEAAAAAFGEDDVSPEARAARKAARKVRQRLEIRAERERRAYLDPNRPLVQAPLVPPAATQGLLEVFRRRYLLKLLVRREVNARYSGSFLGLLWSYINPASQFLIYYFLHVLLLGRHATPNFAVHVFCGLVVVHFFTETFNAGTRSIVRNKSLVRKVAVPKEMFPVASMLVSLFHVGPQLLILFGLILIEGFNPDPFVPLALLLGLGIIMCLGTALALIFSVANVYFRDFQSVVSILTNLVRFSVPMIYPYSLVPERFGPAAQYYLWNPLASAVLLVQRAIWYPATGDEQKDALKELPHRLIELGTIMLLLSIVTLFFAQWLFRRLEDRIPERLN